MGDQTTERTGPISLKRWFGIPFVILFVIPASLLVYRESRLWGLPDIGDPFDVEAFGTMELADEENAALEYRTADKLIPDFEDPNSDKLQETLEKGWSSATPEIRQWLEENRPALEIWLEGTRKPRALYCQPKETYLETMISVAGNRSLARLSGLVAARLESEQDLVNAWKLHRAGVRHGQHMGMHDSIARLSGMAVFAIHVPGIVRWSHHPEVSKDMLRQSIEDLQADFQMTPPISRILKNEYFFDMNRLRRKQDWEDFWSEGSIPKFELFLKNEPILSRRITQLAYQNWLSQCDQIHRNESAFHPGDLNLFTPEAGFGESELFSPKKIDDYHQISLLANRWLRSRMGLMEANFRNVARQGILLVVLAAQLHYREHGRFPEQAAELLTGSLKEIPPDTLSDKPEAIKYRRLTDDRCLIWSAGGNHVDDGGNIDRSWADDDMDYGFEIGPEGWKGN